jgi:hypothetical protein
LEIAPLLRPLGPSAGSGLILRPFGPSGRLRAQDGGGETFRYLDLTRGSADLLNTCF